jgi:hypothetical protein
MKKGIYKSIIYIGIIMSLSILFGGCIRNPFKPAVKIGNIESFKFSYQVGNYINGWVAYSIVKEDDKWIAIIKHNEVAEENAIKIDIKENKVKELEKVLEEYKIGKWDGFQGSNKHVLDGHSFSLFIHFDDKTSIDASGYEKYPSNYREFKEKMDSFFKEIEDNK